MSGAHADSYRYSDVPMAIEINELHPPSQDYVLNEAFGCFLLVPCCKRLFVLLIFRGLA